MNYNFKVLNEKLKGRPDLILYSGNVNTYTFTFDFSDDWTNTIKFAVFTKDTVSYTVEIINDKIIVPSEILTSTGDTSFGLYGTNGENNIQRISTNIINIKVNNGAYKQGKTPISPTPDIWESLILKTVPIIGKNGNWWTWSIKNQEYIDSGIPANNLYDDTELRESVTVLNNSKENKSNKITELTESCTDEQYPSAKAVYQNSVPTFSFYKASTNGKSYFTLDFIENIPAICKIKGYVPVFIVNPTTYPYVNEEGEYTATDTTYPYVNEEYEYIASDTKKLSKSKEMIAITISNADPIIKDDRNGEYTQFLFEKNNIYKRKIIKKESSKIINGALTIFTAYEYSNWQILNSEKADKSEVLSKEDKITITTATDTTASVTLNGTTETRYNEVTSLTISFPEALADSYISSVVFTSGATAATVNIPSNVYMQGTDCSNGVFTPTANKRYTVIFSYDGEILSGIVNGIPKAVSE